MASTAMFAQTHWSPTQQNCEALNTFIYVFLHIDGQYVEDPTQFEIGVFDERDGLCRCAQMPRWVNKYGWYYYGLTCKGYTGCVYNFRIWDHELDQERTDLTLVYDYDGDDYEFTQFVWGANLKYGVSTAPLTFNFVTSSQGETFTKDILGYGEDYDYPNHYYLISSPIGEVSPEAVNGMVENTFDLYYFDQSKDNEWINFKANEGSTDPGFNLMPGKGYLYANHDDVTLTFTGTPYSGDGLVELQYVDGAEFAGWNLVGNPFPRAANVDVESYYRMNEVGTELMPGDGSVEAMEGIFVLAEEDGQIVTFTPNDNNGDGKYNLRIDLTSTVKSSVIDRVIINFVEGQELPKFQINSNSTKVYVPKESQDYAVVNAGEVGELPVCFKTQTNGRYTFNVSSENVSFSYLHLIDNMTGADVNLLATPSYSFDALSTDYATRFRLLFSTSCSVDGDNFSFVNGSGNLCIYGIEGEATLQVVDVLGHMLSSETFSGSIEKKLNVAPGVYMLRLIQGNDVKVQKTVIK